MGVANNMGVIFISYNNTVLKPAGIYSYFL